MTSCGSGMQIPDEMRMKEKEEKKEEINKKGSLVSRSFLSKYAPGVACVTPS